MRVLGIDCSTQSLAFSVFEDGELVHWGEFSFGKGDLFHRLNNANRVINASLGQSQFQNIDKLIYESAAYIQNKQTVILLAYAFGAAIAPFALPGVQVEKVVPMTWQSYIGNKVFTKAEKDALRVDYPGQKEAWYKEKMREIRKQRTIDFVKDKWGVEAKNDNVADAIGVGWWGVNNA